jgi:predicted dehydrogenase
MGKYKVGVFGVGDVAREYMKAVDGNPLSEVKAVVSRDKKKTENRVKDWGFDCDVLGTFDELVKDSDIDVIINTAPHFLHSGETIKAARAGKHVVCEKPIGMTFDEVREVQKAVNEAGVKFQCGLALRWNPFVLNLKQLIDSGMFGKLFYVEVDYFHKLSDVWNGFTWGGQKRSGGPSASLVAGIHAVDLMRYLCGEVEEVAAYRAWGHRDDFEYPPTYVSSVKFQNGAVGKTSCSFEIESPYLMNFILYGSKGSVVNNRFYFKETFPGQTGWQEFETIMPDSGAVSHHPFKHLIDDFMEALDTGRDTVLHIDEMAKTHELCFAIDRSMDEGKKVSLPLG